MLINFQFRNFCAFRDSTEFTMIASEESTERESLVPVITQNDMNLLPIAALFGGNASGKSCFCRALEALQNLIVKGEWKGEAFRTTEGSGDTVSFLINVLSENEVWEYEVEISGKEIAQESLKQILAKHEEVVFVREGKKIKVSDSLFPDEKDKERIKLSAEICGKDTPYMSFCRKLEMPSLLKWVEPFYRWIANRLLVLAPDSLHVSIGMEVFTHKDKFEELLRTADTGIDGLEFTRVDLPSLNIPEHILQKFKDQDLKEAQAMMLQASLQAPSGIVFKRAEKEGANLEAYRIETIHQDSRKGEKVPFTFAEESDGTRRLLHLLPLVTATGEGKVIVADEIDRSLHPHLARYVLEKYKERNIELAKQGKAGQLIFTTHDALLMSKELLRTDEIWITERQADHSSRLIPLSDFVEAQSDSDIYKSYLLGRMGGVPNIY